MTLTAGRQWIAMVLWALVANGQWSRLQQTPAVMIVKELGSDRGRFAEWKPDLVPKRTTQFASVKRSGNVTTFVSHRQSNSGTAGA